MPVTVYKYNVFQKNERVFYKICYLCHPDRGISDTVLLPDDRQDLVKKIACILFSILLCAVSTAQRVGVKDFKWLSSGEVTLRDSQTGNKCALIYIQTPETGWTFEAGSGTWIEDVRQDNGVISLYLSADVRTLSFSLPGYTPLRDWIISPPLKAGDSYTLTLTAGSSALKASGSRSYETGTSSVASSSASSEKSSSSSGSASSSASSVSSLISSSHSSSSASKSSSDSYSSASKSSSASSTSRSSGYSGTSRRSSTGVSSGSAGTSRDRYGRDGIYETDSRGGHLKQETGFSRRHPSRAANERINSRTSASDESFCRWFIDMYASHTSSISDYGSLYDDDWFVGLQLTYMLKNIGLYASAAYSFEESHSVFAGLAFRLNPQSSSALDLKLYAGGGLVDDDIGAGEIGLRFAWKDTGNRLSLTDFSVGCQYFDHCIAPTVSVGFAIWGVPVAVGLCIVACAAEAML
jgi:hypothetical protein